MASMQVRFIYLVPNPSHLQERGVRNLKNWLKWAGWRCFCLESGEFQKERGTSCSRNGRRGRGGISHTKQKILL